MKKKEPTPAGYNLDYGEPYYNVTTRDLRSYQEGYSSTAILNKLTNPHIEKISPKKNYKIRSQNNIKKYIKDLYDKNNIITKEVLGYDKT